MYRLSRDQILHKFERNRTIREWVTAFTDWKFWPSAIVDPDLQSHSVPAHQILAQSGKAWPPSHWWFIDFFVGSFLGDGPNYTKFGGYIGQSSALPRHTVTTHTELCEFRQILSPSFSPPITHGSSSSPSSLSPLSSSLTRSFFHSELNTWLFGFPP